MGKVPTLPLLYRYIFAKSVNGPSVWRPARPTDRRGEQFQERCNVHQPLERSRQRRI